MKITAITEVGSSTSRPYMVESGEFDRLIYAQRRLAIRTIADLDTEIEQFKIEIEQFKIEIEQFKIEIEAREYRRDDLALIVQRVDAMLSAGQSKPENAPSTEGVAP